MFFRMVCAWLRIQHSIVQSHDENDKNNPSLLHMIACIQKYQHKVTELYIGRHKAVVDKGFFYNIL